MAKSWIFFTCLFFTLLCLWSSTAGQDLTARVENLEETNLEQTREILAGKNKTDILEKELKEIRREFEELKKSGTKLSSRPKNIPYTTTCGGLVTVQKEHEIRYQVPSPENRSETEPKFCIWVVKNSERLPLILELKDVERGEDFQLWTAHGFADRSASSSQKIHELDSMYSIPDAQFVLYFRINPSTINNNSNETISFKLNIKRNIFSPLPFQNNAKRIEITVNSTSSPESFSYPLPPSTEYSANERTYIILKPTESGSSLWLKMKSVDTEERADNIEIVTFSERPIHRARLSGAVTPAREFRSGVDEPMIVLFGSDGSEQRSGFSFDYAQEKNATVPPTKSQNTCGGFVSVSSEDEISYQVPSNASSSVCIWVVKNEGGGRLQMQLTDQDRWNNHQSTELFIVDSIQGNSSQKIPINIQDPSIPFSSEMSSYFLLYFRFNPNLQGQNQNDSSPQGFRLLLQDNSLGLSTTNLVISHTELTPSSKLSEKKEFLYPVGSSHYSDNERAFIIIKPTVVGSKIKIDMTAMDTEPNYDKVQIMSYSEEEQKMTFDYLFSGTLEARPRTLKGRENEPVIVLFSSDGSGAKSGFRFTYSEVRTNAVS